jgi:HK97 family phage major capsid protein
MFEVVELRQKRAALLKTAGKVLESARAAGRNLTKAERDEFDKLHAEAKELDNTITRAEAQEEHERDLVESLPPGRARTTPLEDRGNTATVEASTVVLTPEQRFEDLYRARCEREGREVPDINMGRLFRAWMLGPTAVDDLNPAEMRALSEGTDSAGGFTVPDIVSAQLIDRMRERSVVMRAGARTVPLDSDKTTLARVSADPATAWVAENASLTPVDPTFDAVVFEPETCALGPILCSRQLIEDSVNLDQELPNVMARILGTELDRVVMFGSGSSNEPTGIKGITNVNSYSMGVNGANITDYTPILEAIALNDADNAPDPTAAVMAPRTWKELAVLRIDNGGGAGTGIYLPRPEAIADLPFYKSGNVPIDETQGTETDASRIFVGDWTQVMVGMRGSIRVLRLVERYADALQIGFIAYLRADIGIVHPESMGMVVGITAT